MNNTFTIYAPNIGNIGSYSTAAEAQAAMRYLPFAIRQHATIERT